MSYKQFDVVIVPFPFTDTAATKRRPALVLSDEILFNKSVHRSVMAMVTTVGHSPWALDVKLNDLANAGLTAASLVRMKLFTLDDVLVIKKIGSLSEQDKNAVSDSLKKLLKI